MNKSEFNITLGKVLRYDFGKNRELLPVYSISGLVESIKELGQLLWEILGNIVYLIFWIFSPILWCLQVVIRFLNSCRTYFFRLHCGNEDKLSENQKKNIRKNLKTFLNA